jgi:hypothetical protein
MTNAIFVQSEWLIFFPATIIGVCLASLIFLGVERKLITGGALFSFIVRDLLWIAVAVRRILIIDQSDALIVVLEFIIVCFLAYSTLQAYSEKRRRITVGKVNQSKENELEKMYHQHSGELRREEA